jgi:DNA polymerase III delta prime subunit
MIITNDKNTLWVEKYRPTNLDTYIGNDQLKSKVKVFIESGDLPHLLFYGRAGTGKTTLAKLLVKNIDCDSLYINASDERKLEMVRDKVKTFAGTLGFSDLKVIILDECDYITPIAQAALRNLMETYSNHCK